MASTISGVTRIRNTSAKNKIVHLPLRLAKAIPANDPRMVAMRAVPTAATIEVFTASRMVGSVKPVR